MNKNYKYSIDSIIDRLSTGDNLSSRLADSNELALNMSNGYLYFRCESNTKYSANFSYSVSVSPLKKLNLGYFLSIALGACEDCEGLGEKNFFDPELLIVKSFQ